jgi:recombinational DNA repair protein RecR
MTREEIQGLMDGIIAVLGAGKVGTRVVLHVAEADVEPLATALGDVMRVSLSPRDVCRSCLGTYERTRSASCEDDGRTVIIVGSEKATREEWAEFQRALIEVAA